MLISSRFITNQDLLCSLSNLAAETALLVTLIVLLDEQPSKKCIVFIYIYNIMYQII